MTLTVDHVTHDPSNNEFVLYLVEDGPWPADNSGDWSSRLGAIQSRIFDAFDSVVDGHLATRFSDSIGKAVRIQIDSPLGTSEKVEELINRISAFIETDDGYLAAVQESPYIEAIRLVSGHQLGRFRQ